MLECGLVQPGVTLVLASDPSLGLGCVPWSGPRVQRIGKEELRSKCILLRRRRSWGIRTRKGGGGGVENGESLRHRRRLRRARQEGGVEEIYDSGERQGKRERAGVGKKPVKLRDFRLGVGGRYFTHTHKSASGRRRRLKETEEEDVSQFSSRWVRCNLGAGARVCVRESEKGQVAETST